MMTQDPTTHNQDLRCSWCNKGGPQNEGHQETHNSWCQRPQVDQHELALLRLNPYEVANLKWLLEVTGYGGRVPEVQPFGLARTGDWLGDIYWMLEGVEKLFPHPEAPTPPNISVDDLRKQVQKWLRDKAKDPEIW